MTELEKVDRALFLAESLIEILSELPPEKANLINMYVGEWASIEETKIELDKLYHDL